MKTPIKLNLFLVVLFISVMNGCSDQSSNETQPEKTAEKEIMPEVNHENCKPENIKKIYDRHIQEEFSGLCLRRVDFKPSPKVDWKF